MTITHHPSDALLLDYASGPLGETWSLAIATHLALCPKCRRDLSRMEAMGGNLLDMVSPEPLSEDAFDAVMARLGSPAGEGGEPHQPAPRHDTKQVLPQPLRGYLGCDLDDLPWRRLGQGAYQLRIPTSERMTTARLLRIPAGRPVPEHSHGGLELTLVLLGAFSDATGHYGRGDFQEADENLEHQPHAAPGEDCICLAVTDAPLRFKSLAVRIVQPLLGI
jgi:putative transcriptional regulator